MAEWLVGLFHKQPTIMTAAAIHLLLGVLMLVGLAVDNRTILGLNPWVKPLKFAFSISIYLVTIALFISYVPSRGRLLEWVSAIIATTMIIEIVLISMQAFRGTTSHFNVSTPFDAAVFSTMGFAIAINTLTVLVVLWKYFFQPPILSAAYLWGIRLGIIVFVLGSIQGFQMVAHMAHTIGAPDGGPGLPLLNWSNQFGDLRVAHFVGLHGLQIIPLVGFLTGGTSPSESNSATSLIWVLGTGGLLVGLMLWAVLQALASRPLLGME